MDIRRGTREELGEIGALLEACGLPPLPRGTSLSNVLVAIEGDSVVGVAALRVVARRGLTLSLAVATEHRGQGLGTSLLRSLVSRAEELGLRELYARPREAEKVFAALGFKPVSLADVPGAIGSLPAFSDPSDEAGQVMRLDLVTRF